MAHSPILKDRRIPYTMQEMAQMKLRENAVTFQGSASNDEGRAYPFLYGFFASPKMNPAQENYGNPSFLPGPDYSGDGDDGLVIPFSTQIQTRDIPIRMDRDMNFDLLEVRYTVRRRQTETGVENRWEYGQPNNTFPTPSAPENTIKRYISHPIDLPQSWYNLIKVSLIIKSGQERYLYGGLGELGRNAPPELKEEPLFISSMQGFDDGKGTIRTPYLIAKEAVVVVRVTLLSEPSNSNTNFYVDGCLFGYKVAY